jgi:hypothetical protein
MTDEIKDTNEKRSDDNPANTKQTGADQLTAPPADAANKEKELPQAGSAETVGGDSPEKAQPLPPEAGSVSPAAEVEAKTKAELPAGEKLKTEAKVDQALPGVEKPSMTPSTEGASEKGGPPTAQKTEAAPRNQRPNRRSPRLRERLPPKRLPPRKRLPQPVTSRRPLRPRRGRP